MNASVDTSRFARNAALDQVERGLADMDDYQVNTDSFAEEFRPVYAAYGETWYLAVPKKQEPVIERLLIVLAV